MTLRSSPRGPARPLLLQSILYLMIASAVIGVRCPDLVLLDLNLPKHTGHAVLSYLRAMPRCSEVPVLIVTSSGSIKDREVSRRLGANEYFQKPADFDAFMELGTLVKRELSK